MISQFLCLFRGSCALVHRSAIHSARACREYTGALQLVQVVQASTTLPRRCRQAPGSTEGAGWLQVLPRRCRQVLLSPEGAGRCLRSRRCSNRQVSRPGVAGVVTKWCRLAPRSPEGAGWLQAPQKVQAGSRLPRRCRQVLLLPDGAGVVSGWCSEHQVSSSSQVFR